MTPLTVGLMIGLVVMKDPATATFTEDADTTNGSWVSFTEVSNVDLKTGGAYKILSASGAQTYNPTISASRLWDEVVCALQPPAVAYVRPSVFVSTAAVQRAASW